MDVWQQILRRLEAQVSRENYSNWLEPVRFSHVDDLRTLHLLVPSVSARQWLESEYQETILDTARSLSFPFESIVFTLNGIAKTSEFNRPQSAPLQASFEFRVPASSFNPRYTFDTFVMGSCNEFACAAARAVARNPARAYNPLYLYGGVGMGKTHLMQAIGQDLQKNFSHLRVVYITSEQFMNEMINSLRYNRMSSFHERFRSADALLVDDIQMIGSKERTQEEFFHTFNALHHMEKQIVLSSDRPPRQVPGFVDRLRSRFGWGLLADIQPPDLETKMAILDRKAEESSINLPDNVRSYVAMQMRSNIRELEGALIRLAAISSLTGADVSLSMAKQALRSMTSVNECKATIDSIQEIVSQEFRLQPGKLRERTNVKAVSFPRQIAMYLCKELTGASLPEIGRAFNGKHHTTVLHSVSKIEQLRQLDPSLNRLIHRLTDRFN